MAFVVWILASVFIAAGAQRCDVNQIQTCIGPMSSAPPDFNNPEKACKVLTEAKTCLEALKARCPTLRSNIDMGLAGVDQQHSTYCSTTGCPPTKLVRCSQMMDGMKMGGDQVPNKESCDSLGRVIKCFDDVLATCSDGTEKNMHSQQLNFLKQQHQMCVAMTSGGDGPANGGQACGPPGLMQCQMMMGAVPDQSDIAGNCKAFGDSKACLEQLAATCNDSPFKDSINNAVSAVSQQWGMSCDDSPTGCSAPNMLKCTGMMQAEVKDESKTVAKCDTLIQTVQCLQTMRPNCDPVMASSVDQMLTSVQPQYQICVQDGKGDNGQVSATTASPHGSKHHTTKPSKPGKKTTTKKPQGEMDPSEEEEDEEDDDVMKAEGKDGKFEDNKKSPSTSDDDNNGSTFADASCIVTMIAFGISAMMQSCF